MTTPLQSTSAANAPLKEWGRKLFKDAPSALSGKLFDGMSIMSGGFGLCGNPENLIDAIRMTDDKDLTVISNNCGADGFGLWTLLDNKQIKKMVSSYIGSNKLFEEMYLDGRLDLELVPQGTLAERIRAGGAGIPAFYTKTGVGTALAQGKPSAWFDDEEYLQERALFADLSIIKAYKADIEGNLIFRKTARNFNAVMATAAKFTIVEVEELVPAGAIDPDHVHIPGIYVDRIIVGKNYSRKIEILTESESSKMEDR